MSVNRGKDFENEIKQALLRCNNVSVDRISDPMAKYLGVRNICDFIVYKRPFQYYFECKSTRTNTLNFSQSITENQWLGLAEKVHIEGVIAGIVVWFIEQDITTFVPIEAMLEAREAGAKSVHVKDIIENKITNFVMPGDKRRVLFTYELDDFFNEIEDYYNARWQV